MGILIGISIGVVLSYTPFGDSKVFLSIMDIISGGIG